MNRKSKYFASRIYMACAILFLFVAALLIPFNLVISEELLLQIIDENGNPVPNCTVEHEWTQYALMVSETYTTSSDENGFVYLPKRSVKTSLAELIHGTYNKIKMYGIHASFRSDYIVTLSAPNFETKHILTDFKVNGRITLKIKQPR